MPFLWISFLFIFLPVFLLIYYTMPLKFRNATITIGSLLFYLWGNPIFFILLIFLSISTFFFGNSLSRSSSRSARFKLAVAATIICIVTLLTFRSGLYLLAFITNQAELQSLSIFFPMGLTYYGLSCISYIVDIYKGNAPCENNFFTFLVYIAFFPKLLAGPVVIYNKFKPQLEPKNIEFSDITAGIRLFIRGLGKKVLLADNLILFWESISSQNLSSLSFVNAWLGAFSILLVIYFDFSGYTDMARGLGRLLGFKLPANVRFPLISRSLLECCSRFQISLFHWLRYYIYIPKKLPVSPLSRFSLLTGLTALALILWYGWDPSFFVAILFGYCIILVERIIPNKVWFKIPRLARTSINFLFLLFIAAIASHNDLGSSMNYIQAMFGFSALFVDSSTLYYLSAYSILFIICFFTANQFFSNRILKFRSKFPKFYSAVLPIGQSAILFLSVAYLINSSSHNFLCILS